MALVDARADSGGPVRPLGHVRRRVSSGSARWAVASQSLLVLPVLGLFVFLLVQDLEPPYSTGLVALLGVFAVTRLVAVWNLAFVFSDAGLEIYTSVQHHWLGWKSVTAICDAAVRRQNFLSMLLSGPKPFRVLRVYRARRPPITVRASRGIGRDDLEMLRTLALRNGVEWMVSDDFLAHSRERGIWARRST